MDHKDFNFYEIYANDANGYLLFITKNKHLRDTNHRNLTRKNSKCKYSFRNQSTIIKQRKEFKQKQHDQCQRHLLENHSEKSQPKKFEIETIQNLFTDTNFKFNQISK